MPFKIYPMPQKNVIKTSIENFRKVDETLYRGALPEPEEFLELKRLGFDSVISLRSGFDKKGTKERALVEKIGMEYVNFPTKSARQMKLHRGFWTIWTRQEKPIKRFLFTASTEKTAQVQ